MITRDPGGVHLRRQRKRVKPQRDRITDRLGVRHRGPERIEIRDGSLRGGGLGDQFELLDLVQLRVQCVSVRSPDVTRMWLRCDPDVARIVAERVLSA
jgi:hypothetical protein